jgi:predicted MPP superfamily phosphohydrolase
MTALWLFALLHLYLGWRVAPALPGPLAAGLFTGWLIVSAALIPMAMFGRRNRRREQADRWSGAGMAALGLFSSLLVLSLLRDLSLLLAAALGLLARWPGWPMATAVALPVLAGLISLWGGFNARRTAAVKLVDVPMPGLPAGLQGFRIAQISDVHVGPTIKAPYLQAIVDRVNRLQADAVAITGDLVDGCVADLAPHVAPLASLRARHGIFFVTGNQEYYSGALEWVAELRRLGLQVLLNEHRVLDHDGTPLLLAGVTDFSAHHILPAHRSNPVAALAGAPAALPLRVLLAHQPRSAAAAAAAGFDVQLCGHTHGGQFWPWNLAVRLQQPFTAGLRRWGRMWVYTSRGTGYWGPPLRFGAPSEITLLRLVAAH